MHHIDTLLGFSLYLDETYGDSLLLPFGFSMFVNNLESKHLEGLFTKYQLKTITKLQSEKRVLDINLNITRMVLHRSMFGTIQTRRGVIIFHVLFRIIHAVRRLLARLVAVLVSVKNVMGAVMTDANTVKVPVRLVRCILILKQVSPNIVKLRVRNVMVPERFSALHVEERRSAATAPDQVV